jgi:hypothetical protein
MGDIYTKGQTRTRYNRPGRFDFSKARSDDAIRKDLEQQLADMYLRWEMWKCQA